MSISNKNKDHLKEHAGVELVASVMAPSSDDPLRFWTGHSTKNMLIDLYPFADGEYQNPHPYGVGNWAGPYHGRPELIRELAPAIQARCALASESTQKNYLGALRAWWRMFDALEVTPDENGQILARVESVADLHALHEAAAHQRNMHPQNFRYFLLLANDARKLRKPRLHSLPWIAPKRGDPVRHLIPEDQAKAIKILLKQDWEAVRRTWAHHDSIRAESQRRAAFTDDPEGATRCGEQTTPLSEEDVRLLKNWEHFQRIQQATGLRLPSGEQLSEGKNPRVLHDNEIELRVMRAIIFPTVEEADIAYHLALMGSGWNPSTLMRIDASKPNVIFDHPKNGAQRVLAAEDDDEVSVQANKPRARGKTQYCYALKKNKASTPAIVATYLERTAPLREQLQRNCDAAKAELERLRATQADQATIECQFKRVQTLQEGCRSVWLYIDAKGNINWLDYNNWKRYRKGNKVVSYLTLVLERLNQKRASSGELPIGSVTLSDFRDIYARWVYIQSGGNILAVMLALGHSTTKSTSNYLDNNVFSAENDEHVRRFMTALLAELKVGRVDLTILAQLVRNGPLTPEMQARLEEYRRLMRSRVGVGCADPRHPPGHVAPDHQEGKLCGTQLCLRDCPHAKFMPDSIDGIAMRVEELVVMYDHLPRETWLRGEFPGELEAGEYLLTKLYRFEIVTAAREKWRGKIARGEHLVPGMGPITEQESA
jgi:integrase